MNRPFNNLFRFGIFLTFLLLAGCKTKERVVTVEHLRTDTLIQLRTERDSIYVHDSTEIRTDGDTIRINRWHTRYVDRWRRDTVRVVKTDTVALAYETVREVARPLSRWQQMRLHLGELLLALIAIAAGLGLWRLRRR